MKARLQAVSTLLLIALVFSFVPAAALPASASAAQSCTDRAQFIADVTVPDGTRYEPGATFTKTWRLRNIGTCTWTTAYSMVFHSGEQMGGPASVPMPSSVAPGQNVDVSVNLTAPAAAGHYIGYWRFRNAGGTDFGIGLAANKSWWVEINVRSSTQTGVAYDFTANAGSATWSSGAGGLSFPGTNDDPKGFAVRVERPAFESGVSATQPGLLFSPQQINNGFIQAVYPDFAVQRGDRFQTTVGCELNATSCYVAYRLDYQIGSTIRTFWTFRERYEGWTYNANLDLSPLAGKTVKFILYMSAYGSPVGDRAFWGNPVIVRRGATPTTPTPTVTGTPLTATPTRTPAPVTATVPPSACDRVQFVRDVTVPDGTLFAPGATFTKTWRLRNVGTCAWSTSYQLVFFSGEQMGAPATAAFTKSVAVGETYDFSLNMTAPATAGSYRGYWMFKNANGQLFGWGPQGNRPWWVDIRVSGATVTPGGSTPTPTGTTVAPSATPTPTGTTGAPSATPTPTGTTGAPSATPTASPTQQGNTSGEYRNVKYNFKFSLPAGATIVSQSDKVGRVTLPIVTAGTNLLSKYVQIHVEEGANPCVSPAVDGVPSSTENVTINNIPFVKTTGQGAAAGNRYDWTVYATTSNNACITLTFILHSATPGNYATPPPEFDMAQESAVIGATMATYGRIN